MLRDITDPHMDRHMNDEHSAQLTEANRLRWAVVRTMPSNLSDNSAAVPLPATVMGSHEYLSPTVAENGE